MLTEALHPHLKILLPLFFVPCNLISKPVALSLEFRCVRIKHWEHLVITLIHSFIYFQVLYNVFFILLRTVYPFASV